MAKKSKIKLFPEKINFKHNREYKNFHRFVWKRLDESSRNMIEEKWLTYSPYAPKDLLKRVRTDNAKTAYWEITIGDYLVKQGFQILPKPRGGPDFLVESPGGHKFYIEATLVGHNFPLPKASKKAEEVPNKEIVFIIIETLEKKAGQRPDDDLPYIIAINTSPISYSWNLDNAIKALYGMGYRTYGFLSGKIGNTNTTSVKKNLTTKLTTPFLSSDFVGVSGILYSARTSPYNNCLSKEWLRNEFSLIHNLEAKAPLKKKILKVDEEWVPNNRGELKNIV